MNSEKNILMRSISFLRHLLLRQHGQSLVETALILPIIFTISFGMIDLCRLAYASTVVEAAAQAGARAGIIDTTTIESAALAKMVGLDTSNASVVPNLSNTNQVNVKVIYEFQFITPIDTQITLTGDADMLVR
ncbi:MAG: pilus assembly protein [Caldilineaceae bacterium]|nr:pilus assembly protein [Caldilineaceae bacterium]